MLNTTAIIKLKTGVSLNISLKQITY